MSQSPCFVSEKPQYSFKENVHKTVCQNLTADFKHEGQNYCVLHLPDEKKHKNTNFKSIIQARLDNQESNFQYVYFSDRLHLSSHEFINQANFTGCVFQQDAAFIDIVFNERAIFRDTTFKQDIWFAHTAFLKAAYFNNSVFEKTSEFMFVEINIGDKIYFTDAVFRSDAIFDNIVCINVEKARLYLDDVRTESADRIYFKNSKLYPNWFINVNSRKFVFHNIDWENTGETTAAVRAEIKILQDCKVYPLRTRLLTLACRQLADNYEENNRFELASKFRQMAFESERLQRKEEIGKWWNEDIYQGWLGFIKKCPEKIVTFPYNAAHWAYRWTSGYGEKPFWAIGVLIFFVFLIFPVLFMFSEFQTCDKTKPLLLSLTEDKEREICRFNKIEKTDCNCRRSGLSFTESISHSLATATLQTIEYRVPTGFWGGFWVILEKIIAPVQAALLALAIRRKFMR